MTKKEEKETKEKEPVKEVTETDAGTEEQEEMVQVPAGELKQILSRLSDLEKGRVNENILDEVDERLVGVRMFKGKAVVDLGDFSYKADPKRPTKELMFIDLVLEDGKTEKVLYEDFIKKQGSITVTQMKVSERRQKQMKEVQGYVEKTEVGDWSTVSTGLKVPVRIISSIDTFVVEKPDGEVLELSENAVN